MKKIITLILIIVVAVIGIVLYQKSLNQTTSLNNLKVTTSFYPLYFFSSEIAGTKAQIINITPAGAEPHDYEPTPGDIASIENSKLLVLNGGGLETWGKRIQDQVTARNIQVVVAGESLATQGYTDEEGEQVTDPHVWLSPKLAKQQVEKIAQGLKRVDSADTPIFDQNVTQLTAKLDQLDTAYRQGLQNCAQRSFVTSHSAFGYLAQTYNLKQMSISGISPEEEPSSSRLAEVAKFVKDNNIKYIFFESLVSPKLSETIAAETGAKTLVLNPIEGLTAEEITNGQNYLTIMEQNLKNLKLALACK